MSARRTLLAASALAAAFAGSAAATTGSLYVQGPQPNWLVGSQTTITQPQPGVWQIELPQTGLATTGQKWAMSWGCPVAGSEIEYVSFGGLKWAEPSHLAVEVVSEAGTEAHIPDLYLPKSPSPGQQFTVPLAPGRCSATLQLRQGGEVPQHRRVYWIGQPSAGVRDIAAPTVRIHNLGGEPIGVDRSTFRLNWSVSDNFGNDGITGQSVTVAGIPALTTSNGQGDFSSDISLQGVPDGVQTVRVTAHGDGTGPGIAEIAIQVDRGLPFATRPSMVGTTAPGVYTTGWAASDAVSGVTTSQLEVNSAGDGGTHGAWIPVGSVHQGPGLKSEIISITGFADGIHSTRVRVRDLAGNVGYSDPGEVIVDTTPPTLEIVPPPPGHVRALNLDLTVGDNLEHRLGLGSTLVEGNVAPDGSASGSWVTLHGPDVLAPGSHRLAVALPLADGRHRIRLTTRNGGPLGMSLFTVRELTVDLDATSPDLSGATFRRAGPGRMAVDWIADDARSGVARAHVEWLSGQTWRTLAEVPAANGAGRLEAATTQFPEGPQRVRLTVFDHAGNGSRIAVEGSLDIDHTAPAVTGLRVSGPPWSVAWVIPALGPGDVCATRVAVQGAETGGAWRDVVEVTPAVGAHSVLLPLDGYAAGAYRVRVTACDQAGNTTAVETGGVLVGAIAPAASASGEALAVSIGVVGRRPSMVGDRRRYTARLVYGSTIVVTGRLTDAGRPRAGAVVHVSGGVRWSAARTDADGRFRVTIRPVRSAMLRVSVDGGAALASHQLDSDVRVLVVPAISFRASRTTAVALGGPVIFSGTVRPSPNLLALSAPKTVVLEWRDPVRRVWRPVLNASLARNGRFRIPWRFQAAGQRIPMRVRVPHELGWGLEERISRTIVINVR